jgi:hypothetical protein
MRTAVLCLALALGGCAGATVHPIAYHTGQPDQVGGEPEADVRGIRYYEGAHFLIVYTDGKGGLKSEVKFLPDLTRKRSINPYAYLAKNETTLTFSNGMLTGSKSVIDETVIPKAVISAATKVALASIAAANAADGKQRTYLPQPVLFKFDINKAGKVLLIPGDTIGKPIEVTLQEADK